MAMKDTPTDSWKAIRTLEKGLKHYHQPSRSVQMRKKTGKKATTDVENAEVFAKHFSKVFNNSGSTPV
eukprot:4819502-Ditylum_brightwellii.AAC.1